MPWAKVPVLASTLDTGRGRRTRRTLKAMEVPAGLSFPHAAQVIQVRRTTTVAKTSTRTVEVVYLICDLDMTQAPPAELAGWVRGHWGIEVRSHC